LLKKICFLLCCLFAVLNIGTAQAAPEISKITYGITPDNKLRIVLDCSTTTRAMANLTPTELVVTVNAKLSGNVNRQYYPAKSQTVRRVSVQDVGNRVIIHVPLKTALQSGQYKLFNLKKDTVAKRPERVVLDIYNGPAPSSGRSGLGSYTSHGYTVSGGLKGKKITLDPGHGGTDTGAIGADGLLEKDVTLPVAMKVRDILTNRGAIVSMTRTTDVDVFGPDATDREELQARVDVAEKNDADLFISIHCNANTNREIGGFSTYYHEKSKYDYLIANELENAMMKTGNFKDLGVRYANLYVNKRCSMPGALVEMLFVSNRREEKILRSNWFRTKLANAIADGIENFYKHND
jgi:N-acetylmuramoyl-L-alanine amidase